MSKTIDSLLAKYQVRRSKDQKEEFIKFLEKHANTYNYTIKRQDYSKKGTNIIVGDVESAELILTAHYDTPPDNLFPIFMGLGNILKFIVNQFLLVVPHFILALIAYFLLGFIVNPLIENGIITNEILINLLRDPFIAIFVVLILVSTFTNKHNANDNTSGIAVLLSLLETLAPEEREKVAIVFFDEEEKMLIGSKNFKKKYGDSKLLINFDCVGEGDNLLFIAKKRFFQSEYHSKFDQAVKNVNCGNYKVKVLSAKSYVFTSDQMLFKNSVGVAAASKAPLVGYYFSKIHSRFDKTLDKENIDILTKITREFISQINIV